MEFTMSTAIRAIVMDSAEMYSFVCECTADFESSYANGIGKVVAHYNPWVGMESNIVIRPRSRKDRDAFIVSLSGGSYAAPNGSENECLKKMFPHYAEYLEDVSNWGNFDERFKEKWKF